MHRTIALALALAALPLASCSESGEDRSGNTSGQASAAPTPSPQAVREATETLRTQLVAARAVVQMPDGTTLTDGWTPSELNIAAGGWSWTEQSVTQRAQGSRNATETVVEGFRVDPAQLLYPVEVLGTSVRITCAVPDCFKVRVSRPQAGAQAPVQEQDGATLEEQRSFNFWYTDSPEKAARIADALNILIAAQGGKSA